jgi:hypothetical protein
MKRIWIFVLMISTFSVSVAWAQQPASKNTTNAPPPLMNFLISGRGTANTIPRFTSPFTIGNSPLSVDADGNLIAPGISATINSTEGAAIQGINEATEPTGTCCFGVQGVTVSPAGAAVYGLSYATTGDPMGVLGITVSSDRGIGIRGQAASSEGTGIGVLGEAFSPGGTAGVFNAIGGGIVLDGMGPEGVKFRVDSSGNVYATTFNPGGVDFAESVAVIGEATRYERGDLLVIDTAGQRRLDKAQDPYSTRVAGIYSTKPGILASTRQVGMTGSANEIPMAVVGIVPCKVTAENGAINPGDLLVASSTPGHAMKGTDRKRMLGAVVGKALEPLQKGKGVIQVLVTLQ